MRRPPLLLAALALALLPSPARACAVCGAGDPTLTVSGAEKPFAGRLHVAGELRLGSARVGVPGVDEIDLRESRLDLALAYAPLDSLFVSVALPLLYRTASSPRAAPLARFGIGDLELRAKQFVWRVRRGRFRHEAALQGGLKLPTSPLQYDAQGAPLPEPIQPGMGSITPIAGLFYGFSRPPWSFYASAGVYLPYPVRAGPHAGDALSSSTSLQLQLTHWIATRIGIDTRLESTAESGDRADPNSGGFVGFLSPELALRPWTDLVLQLGARFPLVQALHGHHREGAIASLGIGYDF